MDALVEGLNGALLANYLTVASISLLVADYMNTFPIEVELLWPAPISTVKVMYMLARYTVVVQITFGTILSFSNSLTAEQCSLVFSATGFSSICNAFSAEAILYVSVHAFSGGGKRMRIFLGSLFMAKFIACTVLLSKYFTNVPRTHPPALQDTSLIDRDILTDMVVELPGLHCVPINPQIHLVASAYAIPVAAETVLLGVMLWSAYHQYRNLRSALMLVFIRDGFIYLVGIAVLSVASCILAFTAPGNVRLVLALPISVAIPVLATRMALHIRKTAQRDMLFTMNTRKEPPRLSYSMPRFAHPPHTTSTVIDVDRNASAGGSEVQNARLSHAQ
ncbi:hypothetical protein BKA70DRAFT_1572063 [Coprinopsis sp. MPI-PUGE-AT-0042]|nr:hypothetical protein BKA70DRAFT_1572063 [Coprinopsis sp. MPI-PUGE-AT-0042]